MFSECKPSVRNLTFYSFASEGILFILQTTKLVEKLAFSLLKFLLSCTKE